ncbi:MAG: polysaccharide biosynthesis C-terminal domain-containing protein [Erysipelotrichaceae bacterium]|nr:polysaccharide biosynthesis C-terminal domain-containing protein [Erysipelotrichaceae bacterium]
MDKKVIINYIYNILYQVAKNVLSIVIVPYVLGTLGESVLGISDFASNIASWFILFGVLGVNIYGNREIAKVRDNKENLSRTFFEILFMQVLNMAVALTLFVCYSKYLVTSNNLIYYLTCLTIISNAIDISWFYFGVEYFKIVSIRNIVIKILGVALIMLLVKKPEDLWIYVIINGAGDLLGNIAMFFGLKKYISKVKFSIIDAYKHHFISTFILFIPTIANNVYNLLDQTMLGFLIEDKGEVALYKTAHSFVKMFLYFTTSLGAAMLPRIANTFYKDNNYDEVSKYINTTFKYTLFIAIPMMCGFCFVAPYFIPWYLPKQPSIVQLIQVSCPIILLISVSNVLGYQFLIPTGHNKEYTTSLIIGAVTNAIANFILIPRFLGIGAAIGSVVAEFAVMFTQFLFVRNKLKVHALGNTIKYAIAAALMSAIVVVLGNFLGASFITNAIQAVLGASIYFITLIILKEEMVFSVVEKLKQRIKRA